MNVIQFLLSLVWVTLFWGALTETGPDHRKWKMASIAVVLLLITICI
jgi:hypothetical protein